jgi:hypothetical protein
VVSSNNLGYCSSYSFIFCESNLFVKSCYTFNKIYIFRKRFVSHFNEIKYLLKAIYIVAKEFLNVAPILLYNTYDIDLRLRERTMIVS